MPGRVRTPWNEGAIAPCPCSIRPSRCPPARRPSAATTPPPATAADAARQAGYAARSARQTGCALLERPYIVERLRRIRMSWRRTERDEARIALARLEQAWDAALAGGSAWMMLKIVRLQAEIAGLVRPNGRNRARLWPLPGEDEFGEIEAGEAHEAGTEPGPLAEAVRHGHARAERALARHCESREALETQEGFDEAAHEEAACSLARAVEERERLSVRLEAPGPLPGRDLPPADDPPEDTYDPERFPGEWAGGDGPGEDDRADGAETDWLYQRRNGFAHLHDPWTPENVEARRRDSLAWQEGRCGNQPFDPDRPEDGGPAPDHDIS